MKIEKKEEIAKKIILEKYSDEKLKDYPPEKINYVVGIRNEAFFHERNSFDEFSFVVALEKIQKYLER